MKELTLKNFIFLPLFLFGGTLLSAQNHCVVIDKNLFCPSVNANNYGEVQGEIADYYASGYDWILDINEINYAIDLLLGNIDYADENENCNPGKLELSGIEENGTGQEKIYTMLFRWFESELPTSSTIYYAKYLNLLNVEDNGGSSYDPSSDLSTSTPGVMLDVPLAETKKLYALNATCGEHVISDYFIIIIDRDITLKSGPLGERSDENLEEENESYFELLSMEVFPNPVLDENVDIKFNLPQDQKTSIQLIEASTGKQLKMLMPEQILTKGTYFEKVKLNELTTGIYYVVLQTDEERIVKKIVKI